MDWCYAPDEAVSVLDMSCIHPHQDITLHRSLGTRLGITLGFDQNKKDTSLYVMDVSEEGQRVGLWVCSQALLLCSSWKVG